MDVLEELSDERFAEFRTFATYDSGLSFHSDVAAVNLAGFHLRYDIEHITPLRRPARN